MPLARLDAGGEAAEKGGLGPPQDPTQQHRASKTIAASAQPTSAESQKLSNSSTTAAANDTEAQYWAALETQAQRQTIPGTGTHGATAQTTLCEVYYFHADQVGLPEELSNAQGQLVWQAQYRTWGSTVEETWQARHMSGTVVPNQTQGDLPAENSKQQNLRFQGQYLDRETGLHYNTFRYYDADIGRFISPDPIGLNGGLNLLQYAVNPMSWIDELGLAGRPATGDYSKIPVIPGHQRRHNIPYNQRNHPAIIGSGYDVNTSKNITQLPTTAANNPGRTVHRGKHEAAYDRMVAERLDQIHANKASQEVKRMQIQALSDELGVKLRSGKIRLNKAC